MKVAYIGAKDQLSEAFIERMGKEGNDVYFLAKEEYSKSFSNIFKHRFYKISMQGDTFRNIVKSISPECIVFAGELLFDDVYREQEQEEDIALLVRTLQVMSEQKGIRIILLSSTDVYGNADEEADEQHELAPTDERGIFYMRKEQLTELYRKQYGLNTTIVRVSQLYSNQAKEGGKDFLSKGFTDVDDAGTGTGKQRNLLNDTLQPLHVSDLVDALKRIMDFQKTQIYNVTGSYEISRQRIYKLIEKVQWVPAKGIYWAGAPKSTYVKNDLAKKELEWTDFRNIEDQFANNEILFEKEKTTGKRERKGKLPAALRRTLENTAIFALFFSVCCISASHNLFSQIDYLTIYVILISVFFGIRQSAFSVILASSAYLFMQDLSIFGMTNFYSYAGSVLKIVEFVFLGLIVSYTMDTLREELRDTRRELEMLGNEHKELEKINDENVIIKNEFEERILDSKSGFPKLYNVVSRLMVLQPDRIFMEIVNIVADMVHTDTVAVYGVRENSPYLRLLNALNEESILGGKTWDISKHSNIRESIDSGVLYQGDIWKEEASIVLPIIHQGKCVAVILIKSLPYTSQTLYYINLLKTLSLLLCEAVGRAIEYEQRIREELYIDETDILKPKPFRQNVLLAKEKSDRHLAEYCVAQITYSGELADVCRAISSKFRMTDCFGVDEYGNFYVLLNNTGTEDVEFLQRRLAEDNVTIRLTAAFDEAEE